MARKKSKVKRVAANLARPPAIIGGVAAVGAATYAASKLLHRSSGLPREEGEAEFTDADRAIDFEPRGNRETPSDVVGDPSVRTSVGLEAPVNPS